MMGNWSGYYDTSEKGDTNECMYHSTGKMNWNISSAVGDSFSGTVYLTGIEYRSSSTCQLISVLMEQERFREKLWEIHWKDPMIIQIPHIMVVTIK